MIDAPVAATIEAYRKAVFGQDVDAFMRICASDVRVFDTWGTWSYEGAEAWRKAITEWLTSLGKERVQVTVEDVRVEGEWKIVHEHSSAPISPDDGKGILRRA